MMIEKENAMMMIEKENAKTYLKWILPMWFANLIAYCIVLFAQAHAEHLGAWYETPFFALSIGFGISKVVLSVLLLVAVWHVSHPDDGST